MTYQPRVIQLHFDGIEVLRIEDGRKSYEKLVSGSTSTETIEMRYDGEIVYVLAANSSQVLLNRLLSKPEILT